jgi:hypothetical protein
MIGPRASLSAPHAARASRFAAVAVVTVALVVAIGAIGGCGGASSNGLAVLDESGSPAPDAAGGAGAPASSPAGTLASPGTDAPVSTGDSPDVGVSPSGSVLPSVSPSPTYVDAAEELEVYLATVRPIRNEFRALSKRIDKVIWKDAGDYIGASWPPAGRKVNRLSRKIDKLRVDWELVTPPEKLAKAHKAYLRCMRDNQLAYDKIALCLINKADWSEDTRNGRRVVALWEKAKRDFDTFKHRVMVYSRRNDVKVPWKW